MNPHVQACLAQRQSKSTSFSLLMFSYTIVEADMPKPRVCCARSGVIVCVGAPHHTDSAMSLPRYGKGTFPTKAPGSPQSGEARIPSAFRLRISENSDHGPAQVQMIYRCRFAAFLSKDTDSTKIQPTTRMNANKDNKLTKTKKTY